VLAKDASLQHTFQGMLAPPYSARSYSRANGFKVERAVH
jgi:hypothetical protein